MSKHTPGPWRRNIRANGKYPTVFAGRNQHVAVINQQDDPEETEANIDLIAAAPEMLERVETMAWLLSELHAGNEFSKDFYWQQYEKTIVVRNKTKGGVMMTNEGQAKLSSDMLEKTLEDLRPGEAGYTIPWALAATIDGKLWLDCNSCLYRRPSGTASMRVSRSDDGKEYEVDIRESRWFRWRKPTSTEPQRGAYPVASLVK